MKLTENLDQLFIVFKLIEKIIENIIPSMAYCSCPPYASLALKLRLIFQVCVVPVVKM